MHRTILRALPLSILWFLGSVRNGEAKILQEWNFEEGKNSFKSLTIQGDRPAAVSDPRNASNHVMEAVLRPGAKRAERSEVMPGVIKCGEERWIGWRVLRPAKDHGGFLSTFQLGPITDASRTPHGAFQLVNYGDNVWTLRAHPGRSVQGPSGISQKIGPVVFGVWESWAAHVNFRSDGRGVIEVWREGRPVFVHNGPNALPGDIMRIKWGVYVGKGNAPKTEVRTLFDDVRIGDQTSSLREVTKRSGP